MHAAAVNPYDWHMLRGDPRIARLMGGVGLTKPKARIAGVDVAGRVEDVGADVRDLRPGDEVFGFARGAFAEYAAADAALVVPKPAGLSFEQAAAIPMAAVTALHAIRDSGRVQSGQRVLVNGAAGGVGTFAVQIAAALGAEVTGVCSGRNVGLVRSIGAAHVVDYASEDFADGTVRYDVILDNIGNRTIRDLRRAATPTGTSSSTAADRPVASSARSAAFCVRPSSTCSSASGSPWSRPGGAGRTCWPWPNWSRPAPSGPSSTAPTRWSTRQRDCGTSRRDMHAARSSSRWPETGPPHLSLGRIWPAGHPSKTEPARVIAAANVALPTKSREVLDINATPLPGTIAERALTVGASTPAPCSGRLRRATHVPLDT